MMTREAIRAARERATKGTPTVGPLWLFDEPGKPIAVVADTNPVIEFRPEVPKYIARRLAEFVVAAYGDVPSLCDTAEAYYALRERVGAFLKYAYHWAGCPHFSLRSGGVDRTRKCNCGLDKLRRAVLTPPTGETR